MVLETVKPGAAFGGKKDPGTPRKGDKPQGPQDRLRGCMPFAGSSQEAGRVGCVLWRSVQQIGVPRSTLRVLAPRLRPAPPQSLLQPRGSWPGVPTTLGALTAEPWAAPTPLHPSCSCARLPLPETCRHMRACIHHVWSPAHVAWLSAPEDPPGLSCQNLTTSTPRYLSSVLS